MAKDTYKSSGKFVRTEKPEVAAEPEVELEAPKPKARVKKVIKAEEEPTLNKADGKLIASAMLEALEAAGIIVVKTREPEPPLRSSSLRPSLLKRSLLREWSRKPRLNPQKNRPKSRSPRQKRSPT